MLETIKAPAGVESDLCADCPRRCGVPRDGGAGLCGSDGRLRVASICLHRGEEPVISGEYGSITIFLPGCNLRCIFCQNYQISRREVVAVTPESSIPLLTRRLIGLIRQGGHNLNFVSPSHMTRLVVELVKSVRREGYPLPVVYNSNGYDSIEALRRVEGFVDIYMPDMKYGEAGPAREFSGAGDYVEVATAALAEMRRQVGTDLEKDAHGVATRGILVRHLVLPGHVSNSLRALDIIAEQLTPQVHLSLMAQYHPDAEAVSHPALGRFVSPDEYEQVVDHALALGFENGWIQELSSPQHYRPDFDQAHPFER